MTEIMNGRDLSAKVKMNLKKSVEGLKKVGVTPALAVILVGDDEASKVYVRNAQQKKSELKRLMKQCLQIPNKKT